jgi:undecaprenyl-diphosphatase
MTYFDAFFLGILQGLTEFLPVSSSGHLVLAEHFLNIHFSKETLQAFDVILHAGTLSALFIYFSSTWKKLIISFFSYTSLPKESPEKTLIHILVLATIPIIFAGLFLKDFIDSTFRNIESIFIFMGIIGVTFLFAEKFPAQKTKKTVGLKEGIIIGFFQILALIPGVSRSGTTIATAMFQGIPRHIAAEFSFILGTPAISAAVVYILYNILNGQLQSPPLMQSIIGFISSFIVSLVCIHYLLQFLKKYSLRVFAYYLISLSLIGFFFL